MTREEKELLLMCLCAMSPYKLHCMVFKLNGDIKENDDILYGVIGDNVVTLKSDKDECLMYYQIKPFIRPMSSMTDEEKAQVQMFMDIVTDENYGDGYSPSAWDAMNGFVQYCDSHHLDHRGLIFKGLALEATEGMYEIAPTSI